MDHVLDDPGDFTEPDDLAVGKVGDVNDAEERKQVMFAHALEADVLDEHDLVILFAEHFFEMPPRIGAQAAEHLRVHAGHARGRLAEAFAIRILAHGEKDLAHRLFNAWEVRLSARLPVFVVGV